jgi:exportin-1
MTFADKLGIRNFIVQITVEISGDEVRMRQEKAYINKLNLVLVQVCLLA